MNNDTTPGPVSFVLELSGPDALVNPSYIPFASLQDGCKQALGIDMQMYKA